MNTLYLRTFACMLALSFIGCDKKTPTENVGTSYPGPCTAEGPREGATRTYFYDDQDRLVREEFEDEFLGFPDSIVSQEYREGLEELVTRTHQGDELVLVRIVTKIRFILSDFSGCDGQRVREWYASEGDLVRETWEYCGFDEDPEELLAHEIVNYHSEVSEDGSAEIWTAEVDGVVVQTETRQLENGLEVFSEVVNNDGELINQTTYTYDDQGRVIEEVFVDLRETGMDDSATTTYTYDLAGNLLTQQTIRTYSDNDYYTFDYSCW